MPLKVSCAVEQLRAEDVVTPLMVTIILVLPAAAQLNKPRELTLAMEDAAVLQAADEVTSALVPSL